jgi:hypothetical protein
MWQFLLWLPLICGAGSVLLVLGFAGLYGADALLQWLWGMTEPWTPQGGWSPLSAMNPWCVLRYGLSLSRPSLAASLSSAGVIAPIVDGYLAFVAVLCWVIMAAAVTSGLLHLGLTFLMGGVYSWFDRTFFAYPRCLAQTGIGLGWMVFVQYAAVPWLMERRVDPASPAEWVLWHIELLSVVAAVLASRLMATLLIDDETEDYSPRVGTDGQVR